MSNSKTNKDQASFTLWLLGQDRQSVAGRLTLRLCADLAAARLAPMPTSLHEVKEWARTTRREDQEVQQLLPVAIKDWKQWLAITPASALKREVAR